MFTPSTSKGLYLVKTFSETLYLEFKVNKVACLSCGCDRHYRRRGNARLIRKPTECFQTFIVHAENI